MWWDGMCTLFSDAVDRGGPRSLVFSIVFTSSVFINSYLFYKYNKTIVLLPVCGDPSIITFCDGRQNLTVLAQDC
jgi:hypothetical protein